MTYNIVLLENNEQNIEAYRRALNDRGLSGSYNLIDIKSAAEVTDRINNMDAPPIHAIILDLRVPNEPGGATDTNFGIKYLEEILSKKQLPVAVVSANVSSLPDVNDNPAYPGHLKIIDKANSDPYGEVFDYFEGIKSLLSITPIIPEAIQEIRSDTQKSFWNLWGAWDKINSCFDPTDTENTRVFLKRYVSSNLVEKWMADDSFGELHHSEYYTHPPVKERIHTGDILDMSDDGGEPDYWIVITPPCDLSNGQGKFPNRIALLKCERIEELDAHRAIAQKFDAADNEEAKAAQERKAASLIGRHGEISLHYLPPWKEELPPMHVQFNNLRTAPLGDSHANHTALKERRKASLSFHFLPYLLQRYGAYASRIGQPDISGSDYIQYLKKL